MSTKAALILGGLGVGAGLAAVLAGVTPDGLSDEMTKHIVDLNGASINGTNALAGTGIDVMTEEAFKKLTETDLAGIAHHFSIDGDKVIAFAKDAAGLSGDTISNLGTDALKASAQALNNFAVEPSELTKALSSQVVTDATKDEMIKGLSTIVGEDRAKDFITDALANSGKFTNEALSYIGKTPLDQAVLISNVAPPAIGGAVGLVGGAMLPNRNAEKPVVGPKTAQIIAERQKAQQAALNNALQANGVQMS